MNRVDCYPVRQKSMAKIFPSSEKYSLWWDLFISQAAVKDLQKLKGGEDREIDSLPSEVAVSMLVCLSYAPNLCSFRIHSFWGASVAATATSEVLVFLLLLESECKRWGYSCYATASWSWICSKSSSINDTKNDTDSERDGMSLHSCKEPFSNLVVVRRLSILYFTCFRKMVFWRGVGLLATGAYSCKIW